MKWNRLTAHHSRIELTQVLRYGEAVMTETMSPGDQAVSIPRQLQKRPQE